MKLKHILILIILLLLSVLIFYFGWIQLKLSQNTYGIAFTKYKGYLNHLYEPGNFAWSPAKLIPGNFKLLKFDLYPQQLEIKEQGELPSGSIYSEYLPGKPDFSYEYNYYLSYEINLTRFPKMVSDLKLSPDQLETKYNELNEEIKLFVSNFYKNKATINNFAIDFFYNNNEISGELLDRLASNFQTLEFIEFLPKKFKIPDAILYNKAKQNYLDSIKLQNKVISESKLKVAEQEIIDNANFETLKKYGELLNEYPSLIELFSVIEFNSETIFPKFNSEPSENSIE